MIDKITGMLWSLVMCRARPQAVSQPGPAFPKPGLVGPSLRLRKAQSSGSWSWKPWAVAWATALLVVITWEILIGQGSLCTFPSPSYRTCSREFNICRILLHFPQVMPLHYIICAPWSPLWSQPFLTLFTRSSRRSASLPNHLCPAKQVTLASHQEVLKNSQIKFHKDFLAGYLVKLMLIGYEKWKSWEYLDKVGLMHTGPGEGWVLTSVGWVCRGSNTPWWQGPSSWLVLDLWYHVPVLISQWNWDLQEAFLYLYTLKLFSEKWNISVVVICVSMTPQQIVCTCFSNLGYEPWLEPGPGLSQPEALQKVQAWI